MHDIDEMLADLGTGIGRLRRFREWLAPVDPADYARGTRELLARRPHRGPRRR